MLKPTLKPSDIIYISGPMTGISDSNYPLFNLVAKTLRDKGYRVWNPAEIPPPPLGTSESPWFYYMDRCLKAVTSTQAMLQLPGWEKSLGAGMEYKVAQDYTLPIIQFEDLAGFPICHCITAISL